MMLAIFAVRESFEATEPAALILLHFLDQAYYDILFSLILFLMHEVICLTNLFRFAYT